MMLYRPILRSVLPRSKKSPKTVTIKLMQQIKMPHSKLAHSLRKTAKKLILYNANVLLKLMLLQEKRKL
jgi:hypothetical protein